MKYCSKHHCNPDDAIFCSECGEILKNFQANKYIKCPKCATNNPQDAEFCHNCGFKLSESMQSPKPTPKPENTIHQTPNNNVSGNDDNDGCGCIIIVFIIIIILSILGLI